MGNCPKTHGSPDRPSSAGHPVPPDPQHGAALPARPSIAPGSTGLMFSLEHLHLDKQAGAPLYQQIYETLRDDIKNGTYSLGERLPSIRVLAAQLGVARNTIDNAYRQLAVEGYVKSRRGSGYVIQNVSPLPAGTADSSVASSCRPEAPDPCRGGCTYDFLYGDLCPDVFPVDEWRRLTGEVLTELNAPSLTRYNERRGEYALRRQIAAYLNKARGVNCLPEQVIVTSGTQQSLSYVLELFDNARDHIALEDPGYIGMHVLAKNSGFAFHRVRTDAGAAAYLTDVRQSGARLVYTTPSHQFPMGWHMGQPMRAELLSWAAREDAYLIEDDYDCGYRFDVQPVPSLQTEDKWGRVIYFGSFSKTLSPALRISYLVLPVQLLPRYENSFSGSRCSVSWIEQEVLRRFMEQGLWEKHLRRMHNLYKKRHDLLMDTLAKSFDERVRVHSGQAGLFVLLEVENGMNQEQLVASAKAHDVSVYDTRRYWFVPQHAPDNLVLLGFSAASEETIKKGVPLLAQAWFCGR